MWTIRQRDDEGATLSGLRSVIAGEPLAPLADVGHYTHRPGGLHSSLDNPNVPA
jgi:hypothetical protein